MLHQTGILMSLMKFIESKNYVTISMEGYLSDLREKLSNILEYSNENQQIKKFSIDAVKLRKLLEQISYPRIGPMLMALSTGCSKSVCEEFDHYVRWFAPRNMTEDQFQHGLDARAMLFEYKGRLFSREIPFCEENIEQVISIAESYSSEFVQKVAQKIKSIIAKRKFQTQVLLNARMPSDGFIVQEVDIIMGGDPIAVVLTYEEDGLQPKLTRNDLEYCSATVKRDYETLYEELSKQRRSRAGVKTLYMLGPQTHRENLEEIKKRISLGLSEEIPSVWSLFTTLDEAKNQQSKGFDIWKIRVDSSCILEEGNQYKWMSVDPTPVRWLERLK